MSVDHLIANDAIRDLVLTYARSRDFQRRALARSGKKIRATKKRIGRDDS